jgi:hypothetical protein
LYLQYGVGGGVGEGGARASREDSDLSEPFLRAAIESMEGKPSDWLVDLRRFVLR